MIRSVRLTDVPTCWSPKSSSGVTAVSLRPNPVIAPVVNAGPLVTVVSVTDFGPVVVGLKPTTTVHVSLLASGVRLRRGAAHVPVTSNCDTSGPASVLDTTHSGSSPVFVTSQERLAGRGRRC